MPKHPKGKAPQHKLTERQRQEIIQLCLAGEMTYTQIAKKYGCSLPNVSRLMKKYRTDKEKNKAKEEARLEAKKKVVEQYDTDPIRFRIGKLLEIESDIQFAREEKVIHTLGSLHKLHLSLHDDLRTYIEASKETHGSTPHQLKIEIVDAIQSLPPILKKQIMDELLVDGSNVVRLKQK